MSDALLSIEDVVVSYGAVEALHGVSLVVPKGGFVALLGPNGAGKSTLARSITGLLGHHGGRVARGSIRVAGENVVAARSDQIIRLGVGQIPEGRLILARVTVEENLLLGAAASAIGRRERQQRLSGVYDRFPQLVGRRRTRAGLLSGGEQQMVAIGRALMAQPRLLICDELSLGLAPILVRQLLSTLAATCADTGAAVLLIEQNARLALKFADYGYVLEAGVVNLKGPASELSQDRAIIERYLGTTSGSQAREQETTSFHPGDGA